MYKPRFLLKNVISGRQCFCRSRSDTAVPKKVNFKRALVVSKLSHYEFERYRYKNLAEHELMLKLLKRGTDYDHVMRHHEIHKHYEGRVVANLKRMGFEVRVVNRFNYTEESVRWADIIMPTGGDGTFLLAASRVRNNVLPVVGFNSNPTRSEGHLCLPKEYSRNIDNAIERLLKGNFEWLLRNRIRITLIGHKGDVIPTPLHEIHEKESMEMIPSKLREKGRILPHLALNEVFVGENLSARVSHIEVWLNSSAQSTNLKCSGLCVCTGTGSTSWHLSMNRLPVQSVAELLRLLDMDPTEDEHSLATVLSNLYNKQLIFNPTESNMAYTIREMISLGVWPHGKAIKRRGFARKVQIKSKCFDASLVIDGGVSYAFNDGAMAFLEMLPEDCLRTVKFFKN